MYPEDDIKSEFWLFLRTRANDPRVEAGPRSGTATLNRIEERRDTRGFWLASAEERRSRGEYNAGEPQTYGTLQQALLAFLIELVASGRLVLTYQVWLRSVTLIVADAIRTPDLLTVVVGPGSHHYQDLTEKAEGDLQHKLTVSDDWDCLRRDTYDYIVRAYRSAG